MPFPDFLRDPRTGLRNGSVGRAALSWSLEAASTPLDDMKTVRDFLFWLVFPLVPAFLASAYYQMRFAPTDPREWDALLWIWQTGPLFGFAFLAGASLGVPDPEWGQASGWKPTVLRSFQRRAVWVAAGPWVGFLAWVGILWTLGQLVRLVRDVTGFELFKNVTPWNEWAVAIILYGLVLPTYAWSWLVFGVLLLLRARRLGRLSRSLTQGLVSALVFVGSLFGTFWAATEAWRSYFFDSRIPAFLLAGCALLLITGCGSLSLGELRRRHLFEALLQAWVIGLAIGWLWLSRPRRPRI
jgi:hypothetical protein